MPEHTKAEIRTEVLGRLYRSSSETPYVDDWIQRAMRQIEGAYPLFYTKKTSEKALNPEGQKNYALPTDLIIHHPFILLLESYTEDNAFTPIIKYHDDDLMIDLARPEGVSAVPKYYSIVNTGEESGFNQIQVYPIPDQPYDVHFYGYFYSNIDEWADTEHNWLTNNEPDLLINGAAYIGLTFYGEIEQAQFARENYLIALNGDRTRGVQGLIQKMKSKDRSNRHIKAKMAYDQPSARSRRLLIEK
jgi:hypothetical protein